MSAIAEAAETAIAEIREVVIRGWYPRLREVCTPKNLDTIADGFAALKAERDEATEKVRKVQASARTLDATRTQIYETYRQNSRLNNEAIGTLDSERSANALLTEALEAAETALAEARAENARLRDALAPFAATANEYSEVSEVGGFGFRDIDMVAVSFQLNAFRRARAAMEADQ